LIKRLASASLAILILFCLIVATERPAFGYVDPGAGYVALQSVASVVAATGYFLRRRIKSLVTGTAETKAGVNAQKQQTNPAKSA
jgi:hypothetical protein